MRQDEDTGANQLTGTVVGEARALEDAQHRVGRGPSGVRPYHSVRVVSAPRRLRLRALFHVALREDPDVLDLAVLRSPQKVLERAAMQAVVVLPEIRAPQTKTRRRDHADARIAADQRVHGVLGVGARGRLGEALRGDTSRRPQRPRRRLPMKARRQHAYALLPRRRLQGSRQRASVQPSGRRVAPRPPTQPRYRGHEVAQRGAGLAARDRVAGVLDELVHGRADLDGRKRRACELAARARAVRLAAQTRRRRRRLELEHALQNRLCTGRLRERLRRETDATPDLALEQHV